jgi:hypothetical protein
MSLTSVSNATAGNTSGLTQSGTTSATTVSTGSVWASKATPGKVTVLGYNTAQNVSACACATSNGSACTTNSALTTYCAGVFDATAIPARFSLTTTVPVAGTDYQFLIYPGERGVSTGTANFGLASVHPGLYPMPYCATGAGTCTTNATLPTIPAPDISNDVWCIAQTYAPGQAWNSTGTRYIGSNFVGAAANSIDIYKDATNIVLAVTSDAGATKTITAAHGLTTATTPARIVGCNSAGTLSLYVNGTSVGAAGGAGTGTQTATLTPWAIGERNGAGHVDGSVSGVKFCPNQTWAGCR